MGYTDLALSYSNQKRIVENAPAGGGGLSQNGKFSYGYASSVGKRPYMEDFFETRIDGIDGEIVGLFGVFDGHGGARAAEFVKHNLFSNLITHPKFISDTKSAIADAYNHTDSELLKSENSQTRDAGSTASTAILFGDRLLVANVGDSRAVICRGGDAFAVSRDHKPDQSDERERIENAGGFVMWAGTWRVGGVLAVSRAFGDRLLKQYVVADPEIQEEKIDDSLEFLILASDGLWDVFSNEEAVAVVKEVEDPEESTKKLVGEAIRRGSADNITCVVVRFLESKTGNHKASHISSTHASSSLGASQVQPAVRDHSNHKVLAKETNQDKTAAHSDLDREANNQSLNQKPTTARRDDSGHISSIQKQIGNNNKASYISSTHASSSQGASQVQTAVRNDSNHKVLAKETHQDNTGAHNDLDRKANNESLYQKLTAGRNDGSGHISSIRKPIGNNKASHISSTHASSSQEASQVQTAVRNDSNHKVLAKETNQDKTAVHRDLDHKANKESLNQKPIAARSDDSSHISSIQKLIGNNKASHVASTHASSSHEASQLQTANHKVLSKETNQDNTAVHSDLDRNALGESLKQKPTTARSGNSGHISSIQKPTVERNFSSEQRGQKNKMPIAGRSDNSCISSVQKPNVECNVSSEKRGQQNNSDSTTRKASSVHSIPN